MNNNKGNIEAIKDALSHLSESSGQDVGLRTLAGLVMQACYCKTSRSALDGLVENRGSLLTPIKHRMLQFAVDASVCQQPCQVLECSEAKTAYQLAIPVSFISEKRTFKQVLNVGLTSEIVSGIQGLVSESTGLASSDIHVNPTLLDERDLELSRTSQFLFPAMHAVNGGLFTGSTHLFEGSEDLDVGYELAQKYVWLKVIDRNHDFEDFDFGERCRTELLPGCKTADFKLKLESILLNYFIANDESIMVTSGELDMLTESIEGSESVLREANLIRYLTELDLINEAHSLSIVMNGDPDTERVTLQFFKGNEVEFLFDYGYACLCRSPNGQACSNTDLEMLQERLKLMGFSNFISTSEPVSGEMSELVDDRLLAVI